MSFENMLPLADKLLKEDGSVTTLDGSAEIEPATESGAKAFELRTPIADKVLREDGSVVSLADLIGGGGGGTMNHALLNNRNAANQHPISAITNLHIALQDKANIFEYDVTTIPAPPLLPRTNGWRIGATGVIEGEYNYLRFFYTTEEAAAIDDTESPDLIAAWAIMGKQMIFMHALGGELHQIILTDENGNPIDEDGNIVESIEYRPIPDGQKWWFGGLKDNPESQIPVTPFPTDDNFYSILELDIESLFRMMGSTFDLDTEHKQLVSAINELLASPVPNATDEVVGGFKARLDGDTLHLTNDGSTP